MKILAFTDVHGNRNDIKEIIKKSKEADLMVCAGDLTNFGIGLEKHLLTLKKTKKPLLIIPGNHEMDNRLEKACKKFNFIYLNKKIYQVNKYLFFGYGNGSFSRKDKNFEKAITKFKEIAKNNLKVVLVSHAAPYKTKLDFIPGIGYCGNKSINYFIKEVKPVLVICGHMHENEGKIDNIGRTRIINPGSKGKIIKL